MSIDNATTWHCTQLCTTTDNLLPGGLRCGDVSERHRNSTKVRIQIAMPHHVLLHNLCLGRLRMVAAGRLLQKLSTLRQNAHLPMAKFFTGSPFVELNERSLLCQKHASLCKPLGILTAVLEACGTPAVYWRFAL